MKSFKQIIRESDEFASMPMEHLHAETHDTLAQHGYDHTGTGQHHSGTHTIHHYTNRHFSEGHGWNPPDRDPEEGQFDDDSPSDGLHADLPKHGWKRDHMGDTGFDQGDQGHSVFSYSHPNGARLHIDDEFNDHVGMCASYVHIKHPITVR